MRRILTTAVLSLALVAARQAPLAQPSTAAREVVEIAVEDAASPWSEADGSGYANDVVRAAFGAVGIDVRFRVLPYRRCKQLVMTGLVAACFSMSPAPELEQTVVFPSQPLLSVECDLFVRRSRSLPRTFADLPRGAKLGVVLGYEYPPETMALVHSRGLVLEAAPSEEVNLRKLAARRIDAALINHDAVKSAEWIAARAGIADEVVAAIKAGVMPSYIGFSAANRSAATLPRRFDEGLRRISADGTLDRIRQRWIASLQKSGAP